MEEEQLSSRHRSHSPPTTYLEPRPPTSLTFDQAYPSHLVALLNQSHSPIPPTHVPPSFLSSSSPNKSKASRRNRSFKQIGYRRHPPDTGNSSASNSKPPSRQPSVDALTLSMLKSIESWKARKPPQDLPMNVVQEKPVLFSKRFQADGTWENVAFPKLAGWERDAVNSLKNNISNFSLSNNSVSNDVNTSSSSFITSERLSHDLQALKSDISAYDKTYEGVSSELVRQVSILCREKGEVVSLMEKARKDFLENIGGRVQEASDAVVRVNKDQQRLLEIMKTFVHIIDTQKDRVQREVNDWKSQIEDEHQLELARMERRVEMEREHEKINNQCASKIQAMARMKLAKRDCQTRREHRAMTKINAQARRLFATRVLREKKADRRNLEAGAKFLQRCWRGTVVRFERVNKMKEEKKMDNAAKLIASYFIMRRDRTKYLRQKLVLDNEKNKPYWALIQKCNDMCAKLAAVEKVVLGTDSEADHFDDRPGPDRFPLLAGRIKSLEDIIEFRANLEKSRQRADEFTALSEKKGIVLNMPAGHAHHHAHHNHHHHHHGHHGHHGHHRRSSRRLSRNLLMKEPLSPNESNENYSESGETDSTRTLSKSDRQHRRTRSKSTNRSGSVVSNVSGEGHRKSRSTLSTRASKSTRGKSGVGGGLGGNEMLVAKEEAMKRFREEATMRLRESEEAEGTENTVASATTTSESHGLTVDTSLEEEHRSEPRRTRMISPVSPSGIHEGHFNELALESWGGANNSISPTMEGSQTAFMSDMTMSNMSNEKQIQFIESMYAGTIADMKLRSGERVKDIDRSVDKEIAENRESLKMLQRQIDAAERVNAFIESEIEGYFDVETYVGREKLVFNYHSSHHGHHGHHAHHGGHEHRDSPSDELDGSQHSLHGKKLSPTSNKIIIADDGTISMSNRTDCQPLLRAIEDVFTVVVRKPKTLPIVTRLVEGVLKSVGEEMHRGGIDFHGLRAVKALGYDMKKTNMAKSHELRDYLYSGNNSPEADMRVGVFWRLPQIDAAQSIRKAIQAQRGNAKATDQVIIDLVRGCSSHRAGSRYLNIFCRVVEVDENSSSLPFLIYCRHLLAEWQVAEKGKGDIITYEMAIALGATLFRIEDREEVKKIAKRAIAKKDLGMELSSTTCYEMDHESQLISFFERIWASCYNKNDENSKQMIKSTSMKKINDKIQRGGEDSPTGSLPGSHSPKAAKRKTMQLLDGGRRRSIVELGGGGGAARSSMNMKVAMEAATLAAKENTLVEENEEDSDDDEDFEAKLAEHEVDEAKLLHHIDIGAVLDVAVDCHLLQSLQQKLGIWATVAFLNADKFNKGNLTSLQFNVAMEGTTNPVRDEDECVKLFNDLVFASEDSHMSFKTFHDSMWNLYVEGELQFPSVCEEDVSDVALRMESGKYVI
ncbi:hypothetical protein TrST_g12274 [Triparma strigata]|uniref:Uncharacterized protein n=1 Tax=Triparma strigata TaxID=1606541 RepID=A0A9W7BBL8_9STRA|nr:hypothetical protein TrST_g12274 [Triparma strigata]